MLFNSLDFAIFLPTVFLLYWWVGNENLKAQNALIVSASYIFYGWWDWRFLFLILLSTVLDYYVGIRLLKEENDRKRKFWLWVSISVNLGFLGVFKYYNFFLDNFITAFSFFDTNIEVNSLNIILPVGISFYTFQTLSYTIDVYKRKIKPTHDFIAFASFVSFFPQLVAGPIERASKLLPQFHKKRVFDYNKAVDGIRQILWGLFKKIVIADNCAKYTNIIFENSADYNGSTLLLGAMFFTVQIYGDFSGYSDIAIGTSRLFGINLSQNFAYPYFSRDFSEAWKRWHISLTNWFRDYLFVPLMKMNKKIGKWLKIRNTFILFIAIGLWHGANWTFVIWGILHTLFFLPTFFKKNKQRNLGTVAQGKVFPSIIELLGMIRTFSLTVFSMIFFRAENITHAWDYISEIISTSLFAMPHFPDMRNALTIIILVFLFFVIEWFGRERQYAIAYMGNKSSKVLRYMMYYSIVILIAFYGNFDNNQFIYFQF